jgi:hypothetical protein
VTAHRFVDVLQSNRAIFNQPYLDRIVTVAAAGSFLLHHHTRAGLDHSYGRDRAVGREELRHPNFLADDSVNHCLFQSSEFNLQVVAFAEAS